MAADPTVDPVGEEAAPYRLDPEVTVRSEDLGNFVAYALEYRAAIENQLGFEVRRDIAQKAVQQLNTVLGLIGMGVVRFKTQKRAGRKTYIYRLDQTKLQRMAARYGWPAAWTKVKKRWRRWED